MCEGVVNSKLRPEVSLPLLETRSRSEQHHYRDTINKCFLGDTGSAIRIYLMERVHQYNSYTSILVKCAFYEHSILVGHRATVKLIFHAR